MRVSGVVIFLLLDKSAVSVRASCPPPGLKNDHTVVVIIMQTLWLELSSSSFAIIWSTWWTPRGWFQGWPQTLWSPGSTQWPGLQPKSNDHALCRVSPNHSLTSLTFPESERSMDPMADIREGITYGFRIIQRWLSKERSSLYETDSDVQSHQGNDNAL